MDAVKPVSSPFLKIDHHIQKINIASFIHFAKLSKLLEIVYLSKKIVGKSSSKVENPSHEGLKKIHTLH